MINPRNVLALFLSIGVLAMLILACGGSGSSGEVFNREISFGIPDAPVEELESVTITIESMTLNREGEDDVVIETFDGDLERITIDLLDY